MRSILFTVGALTSLAAANINFEWVNPKCTFPDDSPCLTGQKCTRENVYVVFLLPEFNH
jgi:hypothetical protein